MSTRRDSSGSPVRVKSKAALKSFDSGDEGENPTQKAKEGEESGEKTAVKVPLLKNPLFPTTSTTSTKSEAKEEKGKDKKEVVLVAGGCSAKEASATTEKEAEKAETSNVLNGEASTTGEVKVEETSTKPESGEEAAKAKSEVNGAAAESADKVEEKALVSNQDPEKAKLEKDLAAEFGVPPPQPSAADKGSSEEQKNTADDATVKKEEAKSQEDSNKTEKPESPSIAQSSSEPSGPKIDPNVFRLSRDLRHFRDLLRFELGPEPEFLKSKGPGTTIQAFEKMVNKVVSDYEKPSKEKGGYFIPAKGFPTPPLTDKDKELLKKFNIGKTCRLKMKDVGKSERHSKACKVALKHFNEDAKDTFKRRKKKILRGLQTVKDHAAGKSELKKKRPILDSSDSEDDKRRGFHREKDKKRHKDKDRHKDKHKDKHNQHSFEKKLAFT